MSEIINIISDIFRIPAGDDVLITCKCGQQREVRCNSLRSKYKRGRDVFICHTCSVKENGPGTGKKLRENAAKKGPIGIDYVSIICKGCLKEFKVKLRNANSNKCRNDGEYRCNGCSNSLAHKTGKFDKIYTEEFKEKLRKNSKQFWVGARDTWREKLVTPEFREAMSVYGKRAWIVDAYRNKMLATRSTPEFREKLSRWSKSVWTDEFRSRFSEKMKEIWTDQKYRDKITSLDRDSSVKLWSDSEYCSKTLKAISNNWKDSVFVEKFTRIMKDLWSTDEFRERIIPLIREKSIALWLDPVYIKKTREAMEKLWSDHVFREKMAQIRLQQPKTSSQQEILYSILRDLNIRFEDDQSEKCKVGFYTFDCRVDPQGGIKLNKPLLIEVQGDYWHGLPKTITKDKSKSTYLRTYFPEFDLKYLWEHEFNNKGRIIDLLKYWLGINQNELISFNFSDVNYKIIEAKDAEIFISKYHYAGRIGRSGVNLGYYIGDQLIAVCIYSNPVRQEVALKQGVAYKEVLELSRFVIHPQYQVKNFSSWLISKSIDYIKKNRPEIKLLVSFADMTYNHLGTIYKASNWILDGEVAPDYWYADDRGYICHKKTLWNKAKQMRMTESQYCEKYNYVKIWGDKKFRYVYKLSI